MHNKKHVFIAALCISSFTNIYAAASSPVGCWQTIDDETGVAKSYVQIEDQKGKLQAKVSKILKLDDPTEDPKTKRCKVCTGNKKDQLIQGMTIMWNVTQDGKNSWDNGTILDPKTGSTYSVKLSLDENDKDKLDVRGYLGFSFAGRTQHWKRVENNLCTSE